MSETDLTEQQLLGEIDRLRAQVAELRDMLNQVRIAMKNRDRTETEEYLYNGIRSILAKTEDK